MRYWNTFSRLVFLLAIYSLHGAERTSTVEWRDEVVLSADKLSDSVDDIIQDLLGYNNLQTYYDTLSFQRRELDGSEILKKMANNFGQKFFDRNNAVKHLKDVVEQSLTDVDVLPECCKLSMQDMEIDDRFKQPTGEEACYRKSKLTQHSFGYMTKKFQDACAENLLQMPFLRWQYFASESGITSLYPAVKVDDCGSYDARFRPFYVQASVPEPKDVVVVLDKSGSMDHPHGVPPRSLMDIAKEAAKTVVSTLNPHDRVAVIGFSDSIIAMGTSNPRESCFGEQLAQATQENIEALNQFIDEIRHGGSTLYGLALSKAFDYFESSEMLDDRERVILFLSDGLPRDRTTLGGKYILNIIKERNSRFNHSVFLMTYGLGDIANPVLLHMARQNFSAYGILHPEEESVARGLFTRVDDPTNLRREMGSYYAFFSERTGHLNNEQIWSLPYLDKWGIGLLMSVTLPVHNTSGHIVGVVGTDLTLEDFLSDAVYFRPSELSYIFIIDSYGYVIYHPLFKYPEDHEVKYIDISAFETDPNMVEVIEDMKKGGFGYKTFPSQRVAPGGSTKLYGVKTFFVTTEAYWQKIPHSTFSVCVMLTKNDEESTLSRVDPRYGEDFLYHRFDVAPPNNPCKHYDNYCSMNKTMVSLGPRAFVNVDSYMMEKETVGSVNAIKNYMNTGRGGSLIKPGIRDAVWATHETERFWRSHSESDLERYVMWRYIGTKEGILRMYPGAQLPKDFDPIARPWYRNAVANKGKATFTIPYLDAASGQYIMSISKVIYEGKRNGQHNHVTDEVVAVMAVDMMVPYFESMMKDTYPICFQKELYGCTMIDSSGFVMYGNTVNRNSEAPDHITQVEPLIAESLIENNVMLRSECMVMEETDLLRTYQVIFNEEFIGREGSGKDEQCSKYQFIPIPRTNIYMIIRHYVSGCGNRLSHCSCSGYISKDRRCVSSSSICECPCTTPYENYNTCLNKYNFTDSERSPKPCTPAPKSLMEVGKKERDIGHLPQCFKYSFNSDPDTTKPGTNIGTIVAACVVAGVVLILIIIGVYVMCKKSKRPQMRRKPTEDPLPVLPSAPGYPNIEPPTYETAYVNVTSFDGPGSNFPPH